MVSHRALSGLRVVDLTEQVAGSYCTKLLAGLGAEVIKVERPGTGDPMRHRPPFAADQSGANRSGFFFHLNTGKKSVLLDLRESQERDALLNLVCSADVLVESFSPGAMDSLGLSAGALREANKALVITSISNFGQTGPLRDSEASEIVFMALGGFMSLTGDPDRQPVKIGGVQSQYQAGLHAAIGTLAALRYRDETGIGEVIDVSIAEAVTCQAERYGTGSHDPTDVPLRSGNRLPGRTPTAHYPSTTLPCKDGFVHVHGKNWDFEALSVLMQDPRLAEPELKEAQAGHADEIDSLMLPWLTARTKMEVLQEAQEQFMPACPVLDMNEIFSDPQHAARNYFVSLAHPEMGDVTVVDAPMRLSETPWETTRAPLLGEHSMEFTALLSTKADASKSSERVEPDDAKHGPSASRPGKISMPLSGIRVLDLTQIVAGPYATRALGDLGAEVIKIESHTRYDSMRGRSRPLPGGPPRPYNHSGNFNLLNRNKLGFCLNLTTAQGKDIFKRLVRVSDVVIDNFSPRVMKNFGLDYPALREINPGIVVVSITGFGSDGPYANYLAHGPGIDAMSGLQQLTGYPDGAPLKAGGGYTDQTAGLTAVTAVLAALSWRRSSAMGQRIEVSMREAVTPLLGEYIADFTLNGRLPVRWGNRSPAFAPQGCYPCVGDDAWVVLSVRSDDEWRRVCGLLGLPEEDSRYATVDGRRQGHDDLDALIGEWTGRRTPQEAMEALQAVGVPAGAVQNLSQLLEDSQLKSRAHFEAGNHPEAGATLESQLAFRLSETPVTIQRSAPCFGEHTEKILEDLLGMARDEIDLLYEENVIAKEPTV